MPRSKQKVSYFYDENIGTYYYGAYHPMKPHRITMTHHLVLAYDMHKHMEVYRPTHCTEAGMREFHDGDYIDFLKRVTPEAINDSQWLPDFQRFNVGDDCPIFEKLFEYCQTYTGASVHAAQRINHQLCDIAINWAGGLHHAHKSQASGFCYINDIVLCILELLKYHARVLYIDIDIHHGDGVEEAFYATDRVMTVSFHKYGNFFPGSGDITDVGIRQGKHYSINLPLKDGIDDRTYEKLFKPIMAAVMETYRPAVIVLQCGADSLAHDRLGCFNLTLNGHANCVRYMRTFNVPLILLGGGGYTIRNVARLWAQETAAALDVEISDEIPMNDFLQYYGPDYRLSINPMPIENQNDRAYIEKCKQHVLEYIRCIKSAPNVQMQEVPPDLPWQEEDYEDDPDVRISERERDRHLQKEGEWFDQDGY